MRDKIKEHTLLKPPKWGQPVGSYLEVLRAFSEDLEPWDKLRHLTYSMVKNFKQNFILK